METSIIVFAGIIVAGISALPLVFRSIRRLFNDYTAYKDKQEDKKQQEKIQETKHDLKDTVDNGSLSDLIDAANKLGEDKRKR